MSEARDTAIEFVIASVDDEAFLDNAEQKAFEPNVGGGVERSELEDSDFVFADERKFPVVIPKDVGDAVSSWGRYRGPKSFARFKRNLTALAERKGKAFVAKLPKEWDVKEETKGILTDLRDTFGEILAWIKGQAAEPVTLPEEPVMLGDKFFYTFKGKDGADWLLTFTTNAFEDREKEIFTTKSIDDYVDRHKKEDEKGEYWFWHVPGTKFGNIRWQARVGRFLVEAGTFDNTPIGMAFKEFFRKNPDGHPQIAPMGWGMSHGYWYDATDRQDKVYDWFDKKESTVLPWHVASNMYTGMEVLNTMAMNEQQRDALAAIGGKSLVDAVEQAGEARTKELEESGIAYKAAPDADTETPPAEVATEEKAGDMGGLIDKIQDEKLRAQIKAAMAGYVAKPAEGEEKKPAAEKQPPPPPPAKKPEEEEEEEEKGKGSKELTRGEVAAALDALVTQLRDEVKSLTAAQDEKIVDLSRAVLALAGTDEAKIAEKAAETPAQSLADIMTERLFSEKTQIDGRSSLARSGPDEVKEEVKEITGIPGLDWMLAQQPEGQG